MTSRDQRLREAVERLRTFAFHWPPKGADPDLIYAMWDTGLQRNEIRKSDLTALLDEYDRLSRPVERQEDRNG